MRIALPLVLLAVVVAVFVPWQSPTPRADLTTGYISIETLDPQVARASEDIRICYALFEGLYTFDNQFNVVPAVAESHTLSEDGRTYTFRIRESARWSDGQPITAPQFARTWMIGMLPDTAPPYMDFLHLIKGGKAFTEAASKKLEAVAAIVDAPARREAGEQRLRDLEKLYAESVGVRAIDDRTLAVELERPTPFFLEIAATWPLFPLPLHVLDKHMWIDDKTSMLRRDQQWIKPDNDPATMISNGPYRLQSWRFRRSIRFTANEHYWNAAAVGPKSVELLSFTAMPAWFNSYQTGALDLVLGAGPVPYSPELIEAQLAGRRKDVHRFDAFGIYYYSYNCRPKLPDGRDNPFADPRVRRAFSMAVDKKLLTEKVTRLHQSPAGVFIPPGSIKGYESPAGIGYDLEQARQLLRDAGYGPDRAIGVVELSMNTGGGHENVAQAIARMWQQAFAEFGVTVTTVPSEWKVFLESRQKGDFMIARDGWFGDYMDPTTFLDLFRTGNGHNNSGYSDPKLDAMLDAAANELDPAKRSAMLTDAERYVMEDTLPVLPLYFYMIMDLYDPDRVSGVSNHPRNLQLFHLMRVKPELESGAKPQ